MLTKLLALMLLSIFITIFLLTALFGRVWCGWGCPQTVYMELVYRPLQRLFEGRHYTTGGRTPLHPARIVGKYFAFLLVSFWLANTFLAYFVGTDVLRLWITRPPHEHPGGFAVVFVVTVLMLIDFAYMREYVCILMCPYGRLQSALLDRQSMIVAYDSGRGEPRGKKGRGTDERGDCIDCYACVATCPTGIDIRDGLQMECVNCTQCIDACDTIMDKVGKPRGLVRYASQEGLETGSRRFWRPRVVAYPLILAVTLSLFGIVLAGKQDFDVTSLRVRNRTYTRMDDGWITNVVQLKVQNRTESPQRYTVESATPEARLQQSTHTLELDGRAAGEVDLHVALPPSAFSEGRATVAFRVTDAATGEQREIERQVLGPLYVGETP